MSGSVQCPGKIRRRLCPIFVPVGYGYIRNKLQYPVSRVLLYRSDKLRSVMNLLQLITVIHTYIPGQHAGICPVLQIDQCIIPTDCITAFAILAADFHLIPHIYSVWFFDHAAIHQYICPIQHIGIHQHGMHRDFLKIIIILVCKLCKSTSRISTKLRPDGNVRSISDNLHIFVECRNLFKAVAAVHRTGVKLLKARRQHQFFQLPTGSKRNASQTTQMSWQDNLFYIFTAIQCSHKTITRIFIPVNRSDLIRKTNFL